MAGSGVDDAEPARLGGTLVPRPRVRAASRRLTAWAVCAAAALALAGCDLWLADRVAMLPRPASWQALPLRALVSESAVHAEAIEICTKARCGYDAVVAQFSAEGEAARHLEAVLAQPRRLTADLRRRQRNPKVPPAQAVVETFASGDWKGLQIRMSGGAGARQVYGVAAGRRDGGKLAVTIVVAAPGPGRALVGAVMR